MTAGSIRHDGTVLAGVKAKPFGWPPASRDPGSGRCRLAAIETAAPRPTKIKFQLRGVSTVRGDCRPASWAIVLVEGNWWARG